VLRHRPELVGIRLDDGGWVPVDELLEGLAAHGRPLTRPQLERLVADSDKQRFALDGDRIRASQGHSVPVELGLAPLSPPALLFHGTPDRNVEAVLREGLRKGTRHHVHLSPDVETATRVGARRGPPRVLAVEAGQMSRDGHPFWRSDNGVWLVDAVPPAYLRLAR
jgi:putative RNA 2'-phosphotransferase